MYLVVLLTDACFFLSFFWVSLGKLGEKRGSRYLRFALINATRLACQHEPFKSYLLKKQAEGKHYNVAIPHAAKKLVRIIFALTRTNQPYKWSPDDLPRSASAADICRFNP